MRNGRIDQAVILAAGNGLRMGSCSHLPKPLIPVGGNALVGHILNWLSELDFSKVFVVVGYRGDEIEASVKQMVASNGHNGRHLETEFIHNPEFRRPNGISLLSVAGRVTGNFVLLMSDHLFQRSTLTDLLQLDTPKNGGILATDSKISTVFDLEDATKVSAESNRVRTIGKDLQDYNAIDTGMFVLSESVFPALEESAHRGNESLSGGISVLAQQQAMATWDIGSRRWIDVDTPAALGEAERLLNLGYFE